jgi:hypothetical protein
MLTDPTFDLPGERRITREREKGATCKRSQTG